MQLMAATGWQLHAPCRLKVNATSAVTLPALHLWQAIPRKEVLRVAVTCCPKLHTSDLKYLHRPCNDHKVPQVSFVNGDDMIKESAIKHMII